MSEVQHVVGQVTSPLPRVTIQFCTQCKWMLRAAYYAQELMSTFNLALGEVALQPSTGGTFTVTIATASTSVTSNSNSTEVESKVLWDRKTDGGFPETKELKRRVRDVIEPGRDLGHVDRDHKTETKVEESKETPAEGNRGDVKNGQAECEDCK